MNTNVYQRIVAHHEAGHAVIIRALDGKAMPLIWRTEDGWQGSCSYDLPNPPPNPSWHVMFGLGGLIAEAILLGVLNPDEVHRYIKQRMGAKAVSPADLSMMDGYRSMDVLCVMGRLLTSWAEVQSIATALMAEALAS